MAEPDPPGRSWLQRLFISPDEPRLRAAWRLLGQALLLVLSLSFLGGLSSLFLSALDDIIYGGYLLLATLMTALAITLSILVARRYLDRRSFTSLGLQANREVIYDLIFGVFLAGLMIGLIYLLEWAAGWLTVESLAWQYESWGNLGLSIFTMLLLFALAGWQEELQIRGYWLQNLRDGLNLSWGVLLSSALFALLHTFNPNMSWQALLGVFLSGLFLAYGYLRTGQLWLPIGIHFSWNFFEGTVFGFPVSGQYTYQVIRQTVSGPDLITGGAFGPEGGLILLPALILGTVGIYLYSKGRMPAQQVASEKT